jgi:phage-related protein
VAYTLADAILNLKPGVDKVRFHHAGEEAGRASADGFNRPMVNMTVTLARDIQQKLGLAGASGGAKAASGVTAAFSAVSESLTPILAGAAVAAAPLIAATLAGALTGGAGLGVIGLGALLLKDQPAVKAAAKSLADTVKTTFAGAAAPMIGPFVDALGIFKKLAVDIGPTVKAAFAGVAPAIAPLAQGLADMVRNALPGFRDLLAQSGPFLVQFAKLLPDIGRSLSSFLSSIATSGPGAIKAFEDLAVVIEGQLAFWGALINLLTRAYSAIHDFFAALPGWIAAAIAWFGNLWATITGFVSNVVAGFTSLPGRAGAGLAALPGVVVARFWAMFDFVFTALGAGLGMVVGYFLSLPGRIVGAIIALPGRVAAVFSEAVGIARALAGELVSGAIMIIASLPGRIGAVLGGVRGAVQSAFAGAASWLFSAGQAIIEGVASGIASAISGAVAAAERAAADIVSGFRSALHIGSPSLVMAREVGRFIPPGIGVGIDEGMSALMHRFEIDVRGLSRAGAAGAGESGVPGIVRRDEVRLDSFTISRIGQELGGQLSRRPIEITGPNYLGIAVAGVAR